MSKDEDVQQAKPVADYRLRRSGEHAPLLSDTPVDGRYGGDQIDPHPDWLKRWRCLRTGLGGEQAQARTRETINDLQGLIAHTPAVSLAGLQAQAELIAELAWNDIVASTARQLLAGIRRLQGLNQT